MMAKNDYTKDV